MSALLLTIALTVVPAEDTCQKITDYLVTQGYERETIQCNPTVECNTHPFPFRPHLKKASDS